MKRAATTLASDLNQVPELQTPSPALLAGGTSMGQGDVAMVAEMAHAGLVTAMAAAFVTLLVEAALAFQKYRFNNGLMLGATLAAVTWYEETARRKGLPPSRLTLVLIATSAAALTLVFQQLAHVFAAGLPQSITHS
jgi:hypothetical protein